MDAFPSRPEPVVPDIPAPGGAQPGRTRSTVRGVAAAARAALVTPPLDFVGGAVPEGLRRLYLAPSPPESELIRQVLIDAGFHVEFVSTSPRGTIGSSMIYVQEADYDEALAFLNEYLNPVEGDITDNSR